MIMGAGIVSRLDISMQFASKLVEEAIAEAKRNQISVCAVVTDASGLPLALQRMDEVKEPFLEIATDKAHTAATFRRSTEKLRDRMGEESLRLGVASRQRMMLWGGGLPIFLENTCIGGIGVSGGTPDQDVQCASAALATLNLNSE